jgi:hypothetical protein
MHPFLGGGLSFLGTASSFFGGGPSLFGQPPPFWDGGYQRTMGGCGDEEATPPSPATASRSIRQPALQRDRTTPWQRLWCDEFFSQHFDVETLEARTEGEKKPTLPVLNARRL